MEEIKELQRQGKPINIALGDCKAGDIVVLHHDVGKLSSYDVGDKLVVDKRRCRRLSDGRKQVLSDKSRVSMIEEKKYTIRLENCKVGDVVQIINHTSFHKFEVGEMVTVADKGSEHIHPSCESHRFNQFIDRNEIVKLIRKAQ